MAIQAGLAIGLGAGLLCALSPGTAFAVLDELTAQSDMKFGEAAGDGSFSGTVVLDTSDGRTFVGGASDMDPGSAISGSFKLVIVDNPTNYSCTLPASITLTGPGPALTLNNFTTSVPLSGVVSSAQDLFIFVGGSLHLAPGQPAGDYSGTLTMTCIEPPGSKDVATIPVTVKLFDPISISNTLGLAFGTAAPTGVAGTITVAPDGGRTAANVDLMGGTVNAAGFTLGGACGTAYTITLPASATLAGPGPDMTVDTFTDDSLGLPLCNPAPDPFNVGATLHVGVDTAQTPGPYIGSFSVTVEYN